MSTHSTIRNARSLEGLRDALAALYEAYGIDAAEMHDELPTFGGERPEGDGVFSWDAGRVLVGDTENEAIIVSRAEWSEAQ